MNIGFLGTGEIASRLVTGLCTSETPPERIVVSPRNAERAKHLASGFPQVSVASSNQEVIDESDCLFLSIRPQILKRVLAPLHFNPTRKVISLLAGVKLSDVVPFTAPSGILLRSVPLPYNSRHIGPIVLYPGDRGIEDLLSKVGRVIVTKSEKDLDVLAAVTSLMVPYYRLIQEIAMWAEELGMEREQSVLYTAEMFQSLSFLLKEEETADFGALLEKYTTKGGLNELSLETILNEDGYAPWKNALVAVQKRLGLEEANAAAPDGI